MLEGMTTLGFMAAHDERARLGLMVGGVHYRHPGLWVKATTTLDVLSGRPGLAGHRARPGTRTSPTALGFPFPPLGDRFEMLEETLRIAHGCGRASGARRRRSAAATTTATRLLNSPQSISRRHGRRS